MQRIVADLVASGHIEVERVGRRNHYVVNRDVAMRHPAQTDHEIGELLDLLAGPTVAASASGSPEPSEARNRLSLASLAVRAREAGTGNHGTSTGIFRKALQRATSSSPK